MELFSTSEGSVCAVRGDYRIWPFQRGGCTDLDTEFIFAVLQRKRFVDRCMRGSSGHATEIKRIHFYELD